MAEDYSFEKKIWDAVNKEFHDGRIINTDYQEKNIAMIRGKPDFIGIIEDKPFFIGDNLWNVVLSGNYLRHQKNVNDQEAYLITEKGIFYGKYSMLISSTRPIVMISDFSFKTLLHPNTTTPINISPQYIMHPPITGSIYTDIGVPINKKSYNTGIIKPYQESLDYMIRPWLAEVYKKAKQSMGDDFKLIKVKTERRVKK